MLPYSNGQENCFVISECEFNSYRKLKEVTKSCGPFSDRVTFLTPMRQ